MRADSRGRAGAGESWSATAAYSAITRLATSASDQHNARMGLPTGTVTMVFSDMEGSTRLLARLGAAYGDLLSAQRRLLRGAFGSHQGTEMGTEGDSFFVVFASAVEAVSACAEGQRALAGHAWPQGVAPLVRMGLHTGEPTRHEDGYIGMDVHRAARIAASATAARWSCPRPPVSWSGTSWRTLAGAAKKARTRLS
jgi:class 3 adenylate cyclase